MIKKEQIEMDTSYTISVYVNNDKENYVYADGTESDFDLLVEMWEAFGVYEDKDEGWYFFVDSHEYGLMKENYDSMLLS